MGIFVVVKGIVVEPLFAMEFCVIIVFSALDTSFDDREIEVELLPVLTFRALLEFAFVGKLVVDKEMVVKPTSVFKSWALSGIDTMGIFVDKGSVVEPLFAMEFSVMIVISVLDISVNAEEIVVELLFVLTFWALLEFAFRGKLIVDKDTVVKSLSVFAVIVASVVDNTFNEL